MLPVSGLFQIIHCWSKYSWCLWCIKNWMLKSATSHSAQKLNLQRVKICQIRALLLLHKSHHTYSRWWFPSKSWLCGTSGIAWSGKSLPVFMDGTFQMPWKPSLCACVAFGTAFLIASINFVPTKADFRELSITLYCLRKGLSLGKSQRSQEDFLGKQPLYRRVWHYSAGESLGSGTFTIACDLDSFLFMSQWSTEVFVYVVTQLISMAGCSFPSLAIRNGPPGTPWAWPRAPWPHWWIFSLRTALWRRTRWTPLHLNGFHRVTKPVNVCLWGYTPIICAT